MNLEIERISEFGLLVFGTRPPLPEEVEKANELLNAAPKGSPLDVARYFQALEDTNKDGERYNAEWRSRSNPLIVNFFTATKDVSTGKATDETPWCAGFVNWCMRRAGVKGTASASSGSFRCQGKLADPPQPGDIAVFKRAGYDEPCEGRGHVGFWLGQTPTHHVVLGGNQGNRVRETSYPKAVTDGWPQFLSIRRF